MSTPPITRTGAVLSLVEDGWRGARVCSLALSQRRIPVTHLIKGRLPADVQRMIRPYPHVRMVSAPRSLFPLRAWTMLILGAALGRIRALLVDRPRTLRTLSPWCRIFRVTPLFIRDTPHGFDLEHEGRPVAFDEIFRD